MTEKEKREFLIKKIEELGIEIINISNKEICCKCPKHSDTNPSFFFNFETEVFHCFAGCLKGKGIHQLIYEITGASQLEKIFIEPTVKKISLNKEKIEEIVPLIPFLPPAIDNNGETYLLSRGFTRDSIIKWGIQYWDEENAVVLPLENKGYALRYLEEQSGRGKYKFVAGTKINKILFGLNKLPKTITSVILTEGSLDCIHLHQLGFTNTLALLKADISKEQIKILGGITDYVYIMLDGDKAGNTATQKIKSLLNSRFIKRVCRLPDGKDPANLSKEEVENLLKEAK